MIRNKELLNSIQNTVCTVFEFYNENLVLDQAYKNDSLYLFITMGKMESQINQIPEFIETIKLMKADKAMSVMENKLVGTLTSMTNIGSLNNCLHTFLIKLYRNNSEYSHATVEAEYFNFENFFYSSELSMQDTTRLYNFNYEGNEINFKNGIKIKKEIEIEKSEEARSMGIPIKYASMVQSNFIIERLYEIKKIVGSGTSSENIAQKKSEHPSSSDIFNSVVTSLRLLKSSATFRDHKIQSKTISYTFAGGTMTTFPHFENTVLGKKCEITSSEVEELVELFNYILTEKDSRFGVAYRRLASGLERRNTEDKLIDYMIGLETLYLPDGSAELSFRLSLRVSFLLFKKQEERKTIFKFLRNIYNIRSQIVHGKDYKLSNEDILKVEDLLRLSIKLWVKDKTNFLAELKNEQDGKLNQIFFE